MVNLPPSVTAIILARGGSKGIPRKNVVDFLGRPLIAWTILQVFESGISRVHVSTDDQEIALIAESSGAQVIDRPSELAEDTSPSDDGVLHAINELKLPDHEIILIPQVTSPLRYPIHIESVVQLVSSKQFDSSFSANQIDDICVWSLSDMPESVTYNFESRVRRQERPPMVVENGSLYCTRAGNLRRSGNRLSGRIGVALMPKWTMTEIDDYDDLVLCEIVMRNYVGRDDSMKFVNLPTSLSLDLDKPEMEIECGS